MRVVALNLMLAREDCRDFVAVLRTVDTPRSLFEQFYGLLSICEGSGRRVSVPCLDEVLEALRAGNLHDAVCLLMDAADAPLPEDPCLALANVSTSRDGVPAVEQCAPRSIVPMNQILLALVACLAERAIER